MQRAKRDKLQDLIISQGEVSARIVLEKSGFYIRQEHKGRSVRTIVRGNILDLHNLAIWAKAALGIARIGVAGGPTLGQGQPGPTPNSEKEGE